jgi:flagellar assembly protein FliH
MASILRAPQISNEKRILASRRSIEPASAISAADSAGQPPASPPAARGPGADVGQLVAQARDAVLAQFKQEAETACELGRQRGLVEGRVTGAQEARASFENELARVGSIADKLQAAAESGIRGMQDMAVAIAFEALCKMLGAAAVSREGVEALVREAVSHAAHAARVAVRLHPADLSALRQAGAFELATASGAAVSWIADQSIALGGCVVETDGGMLDARLDTQLERLRATLLAERRAEA